MALRSILPLLTWTLLVAAPVASILGWLPFSGAFWLVFAASILAASCLGLMVVGRSRGKLRDPELVPGALALPLLVVLAAVTRWLYPDPDVSTDLRDPPRFEAQAPADPAPPAIVYSTAEAKRLLEAYPALGSRELPHKALFAFGRITGVMRNSGAWQIANYDHKRLRAEGTVRSRFGVPLQFVLRVRPKGERDSVLDMRVRAPGVPTDFGESARVLQHYFDHLSEVWVCGGPSKKRAGRRSRSGSD